MQWTSSEFELSRNWRINSLCSKTGKFNSSQTQTRAVRHRVSGRRDLAVGYFRPDSSICNSYQNTVFHARSFTSRCHKCWSGTAGFFFLLLLLFFVCLFFWVCAAARDGKRRTDRETFPENYRARKLLIWRYPVQSSRSQEQWQIVATHLTL